MPIPISQLNLSFMRTDLIDYGVEKHYERRYFSTVLLRCLLRFAVIKRQKKVIPDDMDEILPRYDTVGEAYIETMTTRVMAATSQQKKDGSSNQKSSRHGVIKYYGAERKDDDGNVQKYCHLTG